MAQDKISGVNLYAHSQKSGFLKMRDISRIFRLFSDALCVHI
jgi:hypothetical protein